MKRLEGSPVGGISRPEIWHQPEEMMGRGSRYVIRRDEWSWSDFVEHLYVGRILWKCLGNIQESCVFELPHSSLPLIFSICFKNPSTHWYESWSYSFRSPAFSHQTMVGIGRAAVPQMAVGRGFLAGLTPPEADKQAHTICQSQPTGKKYSKMSLGYLPCPSVLITWERDICEHTVF